MRNAHEQTDVANVADKNGGRAPLSARERALLTDKVARAELEKADKERREREAQLFAVDDLGTAPLDQLRERFEA